MGIFKRCKARSRWEIPMNKEREDEFMGIIKRSKVRGRWETPMNKER